MHFGVTEDDIFRRWSYWQFIAYVRAAGDVLAARFDAPGGGGKVPSRVAENGGRVIDGRTCSLEELAAVGIPVKRG
jgi:hypothetical protein